MRYDPKPPAGAASTGQALRLSRRSFLASAGYLHIIHQGGAGADGHDQVVRVEHLVFADRIINIGSGANRPVAGDDHVFITEDTGVYNSGAASVLEKSGHSAEVAK